MAKTELPEKKMIIKPKPYSATSSKFQQFLDKISEKTNIFMNLNRGHWMYLTSNFEVLPINGKDQTYLSSLYNNGKSHVHPRKI